VAVIDPAGFITAIERRAGIANADGSAAADHARVLDGSHGNPSMGARRSTRRFV
jgi:hypothetical protein